jgi:hypothetical protein
VYARIYERLRLYCVSKKKGRPPCDQSLQNMKGQDSLNFSQFKLMKVYTFFLTFSLHIFGKLLCKLLLRNVVLFEMLLKFVESSSKI